MTTVFSAKPAKIKTFNVTSTSRQKQVSFRLELGCGFQSAASVVGSIEIFNGFLESISQWNWDDGDRRFADHRWEIRLKGQPKGLIVALRAAAPVLPGSNDETLQFCTLNYGVTFPMFGKISVAGKDMHPLYAYLTSKEHNPEFGGKITWNFNKFLIDKNGKIIARYDSKTEPLDKVIVNDLEHALN